MNDFPYINLYIIYLFLSSTYPGWTYIIFYSVLIMAIVKCFYNTLSKTILFFIMFIAYINNQCNEYYMLF